MKRLSHRQSGVLGRRIFLKALGLGIAAPLAMRMSRFARADPGSAPLRLCVIYVPNGAPIEHFDPIDTPTNSYILEALKDFDSSVKVIRGLSMNDGASNHAAIQAVLTGFSEGRGNDGKPSDSIDSLVGKGLGVKTHALGVIPHKWFGSNSHLIQSGEWVMPLESPAAAANTLFPEAPMDGPTDADFRREALSLTESQVGRMHAELAGLTREQNKLSIHLEALRELQSHKDLNSQCSMKPPLALAEKTASLDPFDGKNFAALIDGQLEVAAQALRCGTAQVITMQLMWATSDINFGFADGPGIQGGFHNTISHDASAGGRAQHADCIKWIYARIADQLLTVLAQDDPLDPGKTVLDNTLIYVCSEVCDGNQHNSHASDQWISGKPRYTYLPTVTIGGAGGYFNKQGIVTVERKHTDMLASVAEAMGTPITSMGGQAVQAIAELKA